MDALKHLTDLKYLDIRDCPELRIDSENQGRLPNSLNVVASKLSLPSLSMSFHVNCNVLKRLL